MEIRLDKQEVNNLLLKVKKQDYYKENAGVAQDPYFRKVFGEAGEMVVYKTFGGTLIDESKGHMGDWISPSNKRYEIKTQNLYDRNYPVLSFDLNKDQWENVFKGAKADGGILCSVDCSSIEDFINNPVVTIEWWVSRWDIQFSYPRNTKSSFSAVKSVYGDQLDIINTDFSSFEEPKKFIPKVDGLTTMLEAAYKLGTIDEKLLINQYKF